MKILFLLFLLCVSSSHAENSRSKDQENITASFQADNNVYTGLKVDTSMDFTTGSSGGNFGIYSIARGNGAQGPWGIHDIVGVHGMAVKNGNFWAAGMHCDVYDTVGGGTSICLNIEFPQTQKATYTIGINMQPHIGARGLVGIQFQNSESFKYSLYAPNSSIVFGQVDTVPFGMRFNIGRQSLEFFRAIGNPDETKVGEIKMDFGQAR